MKIEQLEIPKQPRRHREKRCSRIVKSSGTFIFDGNNHRCGRIARFTLDGVAFCKQHAGEFSLIHLMKTDA